MGARKLKIFITNFKEDIYTIIIGLIFLTLVFFREKYSSHSLFVLIGFYILCGDFLKIKEAFKNKIVLIFIAPFLFYTLGMLYTSNINQGFELLSRKALFFIFPVILSQIGVMKRKNIDILKITFVLVIFTSLVYCQYKIYLDWYKTNWPISKLFSYYKFGYVYFTQKINLHPTYFSFFILVALIFLIDFYKKAIPLLRKFLLCVLIIYLFYNVFVIASKIGVIALVGLFIYYFVNEIKNKIKLTFVFGLLFFLISFKNDFIFKRFEAFLFKKEVQLEGEKFSRLEAYKVFTDIFTENIFIGNGTGDVVKVVINKKEYNFHNEYIEVYLALGLLGLFVFVFAIFYPLRIAILKRYNIYFLFLFLTSVFLLTESLFYRHKGLMFFTLFNSLLAFNFSNKLNNYFTKNRVMRANSFAILMCLFFFFLSCKKEEKIKEKNSGIIKEIVDDNSKKPMKTGLILDVNFNEEDNLESFGGVNVEGRKSDDLAIKFNGKTNFFEVDNEDKLNPEDGLTIATWVKPNSFKGNGNNAIVSKAFDRHKYPFYQYHLGIVGDDDSLKNNASFTFYLTINNKLYSIKTKNNIWQPESWYSVIGVYNGREMKLYVNGVLEANKFIKGKIDSYDTNLFIAKYDNLGSHTPITIDEVKIYNQALAEEKIKKLSITD